MNTVDHKCPNCTATLTFNPSNQRWDCEYCKSSFELKDLKLNKENFLRANNKPLKDLDVYTCKNCGAEIMADVNTTATFCVYCKSTAIIKNRLTDAYEPTAIIPFKKTKEEAITAFKNIGIRKIFMPKKFSDEKNIQEMRGIYIPFWLFDFECSGELTGTATKVTRWSNYDYRYTKTDFYQVERRGTFSFDNIPVDGSKNFNDAIMNSIEPFDYKELQKFNYSYLSGFYAEKYDLDDNEVVKDASIRALSTVQDILSRELYGYTSKSTSSTNKITKQNSQYVLFPVWMLNIKYKGEIRPFAMNGQTGKMIGDIPIDYKKLVIFTIILFGAIFLLGVLAFTLIGGYVL